MCCPTNHFLGICRCWQPFRYEGAGDFSHQSSSRSPTVLKWTKNAATSYDPQQPRTSSLTASAVGHVRAYNVVSVLAIGNKRASQGDYLAKDGCNNGSPLIVVKSHLAIRPRERQQPRNYGGAESRGAASYGIANKEMT